MKGSNIIVALDYPDRANAMQFAENVEPELCKLKVGKQLFTACGPEIVEVLINKGFDVFLDLKFHDIPNTVHQACISAMNMGVWMLNVHAIGGKEMLCAAREAVPKNDNHFLVAVTVLTSTCDDDLKRLEIPLSIDEMVLTLARLTAESALDGVVCSAHETRILRAEFGDSFCLVTPGIRPADTSPDDQKRIQTPGEAIASGSNYLVIGRPVTQSDNPLGVLESINKEISSVIN